MFGSEKRKARKRLDAIWQSVEMNCRNNYKDLAQEYLAKYEEELGIIKEQGVLPAEECTKRNQQLVEKKQALQGYDHKQHIGW